MAAIPMALVSGAIELVKRFWPDKTEQEQRELAERMTLATQEFDLLKGQLDINKVEAASNNLFVAGWRPSIGWVCASAYAYSYVLQPFLSFIFAAFGHPVQNIPILNMSEMMPVLGGILGLGYYRTQEKIKGIKK